MKILNFSIILIYCFTLQHEANRVDSATCNIDTSKVKIAIKSPLQWSKGYSESLQWELSIEETTAPERSISMKVKSTSNFSMVLSGGILQTQYTFNRFHFHWATTNNKGSEHTINGNSHPMEVHLVHEQKRNPNLQEFALVSYFFNISKDNNSAIEKILPLAMKAVETHQSQEVKSFALSDLFPKRCFLYFHYDGLLASNYTESSNWMIFYNPLSISESQLNVLRNAAEIDTSLKNNYDCPRKLTDSVPIELVV